MKKEIKLNLVTFCLINAMNINIAEAQTEEILDQNKCGRKKCG